MLKLLIYGVSVLREIVLDPTQNKIKNGPYLLVNNKGQWLLNGESFKDYRLKNGYQTLVLPNTFYEILLQVKKVKSKKYTLYSYRELTIGQDSSSSIQILEPLFKRFNFKIKDNMIYSDCPFIYVNGHRYHDYQRINNGEEILIGSLCIIYNERFLLIPKTDNEMDFVVNLKPLKSLIIHKQTLNYLHVVKNFRRYTNTCPVFVYDLPHVDLKQSDINSSLNGFGLIQGMIMSAGLLLMSLFNYHFGKINGRSEMELLQLLIMPSVMVCGTLLIPLIRMLYLLYKRHQNEYLENLKIQNKLNDFKDQIIADLVVLKQYNHQFAYDLKTNQERLQRAELYELEQNDYGFKMLNLGTYLKDLKITYNNQNFNEKFNYKALNLIKDYRFQSVDFVADLKKYQIIEIKGSEFKVVQYVLSLIGKLASSHNYEDLKIAIILKTNSLLLTYIKNLRHFYYEGQRLIFIQGEDCSMIEQIEKDLVVFDFSGNYHWHLNPSMALFLINNYDSKNKNMTIDLDKMRIDDYIENDSFNFEYLEALQDNLVILKQLPLYVLDTKEFNHGKTITLFDMYGQNLNLKQRYRSLIDKSHILIGLKENGAILKFDLSEGGIGPHILITGATGSGKSELVLTILLGIALNYTAEEASIALIDYKGTGLKETLSYHERILPHISLSLTNLNPMEFDRSLKAFEFELLKRERLFKRLAELAHASIMNLKDYQAFNQQFKLENLSEFFIVIDEFAELKKERPSFMHEINRVARVGRSLGFHLILVTQKLGGVIDQEIAANISARIALKTNTIEDSYEMINTKDAFLIKHPGEFYVLSQKGLNFGRAIYTRAFVDSKVNQTVCLVNHRLNQVASIKNESHIQERQIGFLVKQIIDYHQAINFSKSSIFLEPLQEHSFDELVKKYDYRSDGKKIVLGEYDDYANMCQGLLTCDLIKNPFIILCTNTFKRASYWLNNVLSSLKNQFFHVVLVTYNPKRWDMYFDSLEIVDANNREDLLFMLRRIEDFKEPLMLLIDDYLILKDCEQFEAALIKIMLRPFNQNFYLQMLLTHGQKLNYRLLQLFKIYTDNNSKEELMNVYGLYNEHSEEFTYMHNRRLIGFKLAQNEVIEPCLNTNRLVIEIPTCRKCIKDDTKILLGYTHSKRCPYFIKRRWHCLFISWYDELLNKFQSIIGSNDNYVYENYHNVKSLNGFDHVIWLGPHLKDQFLIMTNLKQDLTYEQAYIYDLNQKEVIELINE